ncbi:hypothetical protein HU200_053600 [Digitaria exilis]|uniref:Uncharacterized protein n=1 Tax=Digitaria exilis TaxID=1010633 RepID=A0A835AJF6_9POAL|nr:hypothetical protein HU200_053600 [Digitaria exilis]
MEDVEPKNGSDVSGSEVPPSNLQSGQVPKSGAPTAFEKRVVEQVIDLAIDKILHELSAKVMAESDEDKESLPVLMDLPHDKLRVNDKEQGIDGVSSILMP